MTAQLLTALSDSAPAKSGIGALLSKTIGTKEGGVSFAALLGQQSDALDPQLLEMLQSLDLDPQTQKELIAQLKDLGVDPKKLPAILHQAQVEAHIKNPPQAQTESSTDITKNTKAASEFINSTLFIASESKAMRTDTESGFHIGKNSKNSKNSRDSLNLRFDLNTEIRNTNTKTTMTSFNARTATATNSPNHTLQPVLTAADNGKPPTLSVELAALSPASSPSTAIGSTTLHTSAFTPTHSAQIITPVNQTAQWGTDFGRVMVQLSQQAGQHSSAGLQTAEIRLDPPELGPLRIVLSVNDSVANAMIFAAHAHTRLTVEQSIPQLQQQLAQAGLTLGEANVSDQNFFAQSEQQTDQNQTGDNKTFSLDGMGQNTDKDSLLGANTESKPSAPNAIIDTFA